jgi:hypothetical protein
MLDESVVIMQLLFRMPSIMPDNTQRRRPEDPTKININQSWEIGYWTQRLSISESQLRTAVRHAGPLVVDVQRWLKQQHR